MHNNADFGKQTIFTAEHTSKKKKEFQLDFWWTFSSPLVKKCIRSHGDANARIQQVG